MPSRLSCVAILVAWVLATVGLFRRDLLPEILIGSPPDLRTIAQADGEKGPTRWAIQVVETRFTPGGKEEVFRAVGNATTESVHRDDGWVELKSKFAFDSADLLKGTPFALREQMRLDVESSCMVDASGNPRDLKARLRESNAAEPLINLTGTFEKKSLVIRTSGIIPELSRTVTFPYEPKSMVQNVFSPIDRLPGLQVGQRWESKVVSPLTGKADVVRVEVERQAEIYWGNSLVKTFVVVQRMPPISARTWVRTDGLVLRQELPMPLVRLVLERLP
jgi:hypothetical protein